MVDIGVAAPCLVATSPVIAVLALVARRETGGSAFFVHRRVGRDGVDFPMLKLRTLPPGTDERLRDAAADPDFDGDPFKIDESDACIGRAARRMRRSKLDELPQLVNVLLGHMTLVGMRPVVAEQLAVRSPMYRSKYVAHRPGLTGLWQIDALRRSPSSRAEIDEEWFDARSLTGDLRIALVTPYAMYVDWRRSARAQAPAARR